MFVENKTTEFKREYVEDIKNTIVAFANCDGGTLCIGVNDDGTACGVDDVDDTMLHVTNAVRDAVWPDITMFVECRNDVMDEKAIV
ncbi:ATP-binding protein [Lachnospiraceae bacterium JLR.KK008]